MPLSILTLCFLCQAFNLIIVSSSFSHQSVYFYGSCRELHCIFKHCIFKHISFGIALRTRQTSVVMQWTHWLSVIHWHMISVSLCTDWLRRSPRTTTRWYRSTLTGRSSWSSTSATCESTPSSRRAIHSRYFSTMTDFCEWEPKNTCNHLRLTW